MTVVRTVTSSPPDSDPSAVSVLVVDRSSKERQFLRFAIDGDPGLVVVGEARNGREAIALVERLRPAVVVMELEMPSMSGIEVIERVMATAPTPILVCSAEGDAEEAAAALAAGAVDIVARPLDRDADRGPYAEALRRGVRVASRVRVITHPRGKLRARSPDAVLNSGRTRGPDVSAGEGWDGVESMIDIIAIGASTGGPQALAVLLGSLPRDLPVPVVIAQHMADGFVEGLAAWLDNLCPMPVSVARNGPRLLPGSVTIAPSGCNLVVREGFRAAIEPPPPGQFHVPGVDVTFMSVARVAGPRSIGVLLTGMGRDGALGLKEMLDRGAITVGQDEATSAVWGMPGAAAQIGAVQHQLPLPAIAPALVELVRGTAKGC